MAGRRSTRVDLEETDTVEELEDLVRQHEREQPTEEERREFRNLHSKIREELIANREDISGDSLQNVLEKIEQNFSRVQTPREAVKDAENIRLLSEMQRQRMQAYDLNLVRFLPGEFAENLKAHSVDRLKSQPDRSPLSKKSWAMLGQQCQVYYKKSPALHFMYGSFARGEVVRKVVARERKPKDTEPSKATELKQLNSFKDTKKNETTAEEVEEVLQTLWRYYESNERRPICYFEFVMNPFSFGQSVENIFYISFLARDGYIQLYLDPEGLPVLEPVDGSRDGNKPDSDASRQQVVISITPSEWREIIDTFKITQPLIKSRPVRATQNGVHSDGPSASR